MAMVASPIAENLMSNYSLILQRGLNGSAAFFVSFPLKTTFYKNFPQNQFYEISLFEWVFSGRR
jgi:hypothetical protein